jgi:FtsP/CotA-like multicopper oxidase with cupredoxin domain
MPEYSIVISQPEGSTKFIFDPNSQPVAAGDLVSWSNRTNAKHTIVIDNQPGAAPMPAEPWDSSKPAYKVATAVTYKCIEPEHGETGSITIGVVVLMMMLLAGLAAPSLKAQGTPAKCGDLIGGEIQDIPKIDRDDVKSQVRGTLVTVGEKTLIAFVKGARVTDKMLTDANINCVAQWLRTYRKDGPVTSQQPNAAATLPVPGPTIRAKVGDLVELTFLNLVDPLNFPGTDTGKCDAVTGDKGEVYPKTDTFPNCFHGSVFTNVHYHGTHTSPNSTGDNVFLEIVPSPRSKDNARTPTVTADTVREQFKRFFDDCEMHLNRDDSPQQWPRIWKDLPLTFRLKQNALLKVAQPTLYAANQNAISYGAFPQNYIGAFPYCYRLPVYKPLTFPPAPMTEERMTHTAGAGSAEHDEAAAPTRDLLMGQAPGTHWYHAHKHGSTTLNVSNGMTGVLIIEGAYDKEINDAYKQYGGIKEQVILLNQIGVTPRREGGTESSPGPYFSVNGRLQPTIPMRPGEVQFWRIANTSGRTSVIFTAPAGVTWRQLAQDGVQFTNDNYKASENTQFVLASGNRADLLVKAPAQASATVPLSIGLTVDPAAGSAIPTPQLLLNITTGATAHDMPFMDRSNAYFPPFLKDITEVTGHKEIVFATDRNPQSTGGFSNHTIDGKKFSGEVGALVLLNQVEEWKIVNASYAPKIAHPFHIHINPFQISEVFSPNDTLQASPGVGTLNIAASSATVTTSGPNFATIHPGWVLNITGVGLRTVASVQPDNTTLTLTAAIGTTPVSGAAYTINAPRYVFLNTWPLVPGQCYLDPNDSATWKPCAAVPQPPATQRIWWDVFSIPSGISVTWAGNTAGTNVPGYFKLRSRFVDYSGYYVIHCHILAHEDRGMMTVVSVAPLQPPFSHH